MHMYVYVCLFPYMNLRKAKSADDISVLLNDPTLEAGGGIFPMSLPPLFAASVYTYIYISIYIYQELWVRSIGGTLCTKSRTRGVPFLFWQPFCR